LKGKDNVKKNQVVKCQEDTINQLLHFLLKVQLNRVAEVDDSCLLLMCFFLMLLYPGRLHQVEYAIEAINNAGTCVALLSTDGIVMTAERQVVSKLLAPSKTSEKTYKIDNHVVALVAGLTADANILINESRLGSQR
jgi:hypothetical protein